MNKFKKERESGQGFLWKKAIIKRSIAPIEVPVGTGTTVVCVCVCVCVCVSQCVRVGVVCVFVCVADFE